MYQILVCDDDKEIVEAIRIYLSGEGYQVISAYNGREALEAVHKEPPHLAILDIMMPELSGLEICKFVRSHVDCPIIFISAKGKTVDIVAIESMKNFSGNIDDLYYEYGFTPKQIAEKIKNI